MPHIDVKFFPQELSEEQQQALARDLCSVIQNHLGSKESSVSVALEQVPADRWKAQVYDVTIAPQLETLAKKPGYRM